MLQSVTPLTLELIEFILKQQISLKLDRYNVILNRLALLFFLTFFFVYILSPPDWSSFSAVLGSCNCHVKIAVVREKQQCAVCPVTNSQVEVSLKEGICCTHPHRHTSTHAHGFLHNRHGALLQRANPEVGSHSSLRSHCLLMLQSSHYTKNGVSVRIGTMLNLTFLAQAASVNGPTPECSRPVWKL